MGEDRTYLNTIIYSRDGLYVKDTSNERSIRNYVVESRFFMNAEQEYYAGLIDRLRQLPEEAEWLEYKVNN